MSLIDQLKGLFSPKPAEPKAARNAARNAPAPELDDDEMDELETDETEAVDEEECDECDECDECHCADDASGNDDEDDGDDDEADDDDDEIPEALRDREARIQAALEGPTVHVYSDHDKTPQGLAAIKLGIHNNLGGGRATYDYLKVKGADLTWPDLDAARVGHLEPWLCYGPEADGGWIDLNTIPSGKERKFKAAFQALGDPDWPPTMSADDAISAAKKALSGSEADFAEVSKLIGFRSNELYTERDYCEGMLLELKRRMARQLKKQQGALDAAMDWQREQMDKHVDAAKAGGLMSPVDGITLEDWAAGNAKIAQGTPVAEVLKVLKIEQPTWDAASKEWTARMSRDTTFAIAKVYGDAFTNPNMGRFASVVAPKGGGAAVEKVKNSLDLYVKILRHQEIASGTGVDPSAVLAEYGLTAADWGTVGGYWSQKIHTDISIIGEFTELTQKWEEQMKAAPKAADDIEF